MHEPITRLPARGLFRGEGTLLADAATLAGMGAWSCHLATDGLEWTGGVFDLFGLEQDVAPDRRDAAGLYDEPSRAMMEKLRRQAIAGCGGFSMEARILRPDGEQRWMRLVARTEAVNGRAVRLYGMKQDITEDKAKWEQLRQLAERDTLTGLANRARFHAGFLDLQPGSEAMAAIGSLVLFDLNDFKIVNDRWGHAAGDTFIASFAERLATAFPQALMVTRIGGDEFAVLLPSGLSPAETERLVRDCIPGLSAPLHTLDWTLATGFSAGIAFNPPGRSSTPEALFAAADTALYAAKRTGGTALCLASKPGRQERRRA